MCEVLPTIDESSPSPDGENSRLEQLMITMLEERDQLMEKLRESQESYNEATKRLGEVEADNSLLMRQLQALMPEEEDRLHSLLDEIRASGGMISGSPEDMKKWPVAKKFAALARDLASAKERMSEREEEVQELKSERANTRLLLEHLECLVARHERSLRMTVVKRQTTNTGVSSEVEVLKALKSLFDHHKALDEKVRERLRSAQERNVILEDELMLANQEIKSLHDRNKAMKRQLQQRNSVRLSMCYDNISFTKEQLALLEDRDQTIGDLQFSLDEKDTQLDEAIHLRDDLAEKLQEVEEELTMALKELQREQHSVKINTKQINELVSSRSKLDARVSELQTQLTETQLQLSRSRDQREQLGNQLITMEGKLVKAEEDAVSGRAELKQKEALLLQSQTLNEALQRRHTEQMSEAEQWVHAEHRIKQLEAQLETKDHELVATQEKESVNEGHISRLQSTIERMLRESDERMKTHYTERKALSDEKSTLQKRVESLQKELASSQQQTQEEQREVERLKGQLEKGPKTSTPRSSRPRSHQLRYSWQITDLDKEMSEQAAPDKQTPAAVVEPSGKDAEKKPDMQRESAAGEGVTGEGDSVGVWDLGEPEAVSKLMSMLEGQVSELDKKLENMGDNKQADKFDELLQKMAEGSYQPPDLDTLPLSSPPGSRSPLRTKHRPAAFDTFPKSLYQVNLSGGSPLASPASTSSGGGSPTISAKHKPLRHRGSFSKLFRRKDRGSGHKKNSARRASAPIPRSSPRTGDTGASRDTVDFGDLFSSEADTEEEKRRKSELLSEVLERGTPFAVWDSTMVLAWLEVWVGVPIWYIGAIKSCVHSGAMLANITEVELAQELGITNTLHRLKLRLAVQEIVSLTSGTHPRLARTTSLYGEMSHDWISDYWLPSLGLSQYSEVFRVCLVDARMLEHLTKKDLRTVLKMVDSTHRNSLQYGISVLKKVDYNRSAIEQRREAVSVESHKDVLVWTNDHVISWAESIGLSEYAPNLKESGVHGGSIALDNDFDCEKLALALRIPPTILEVQRKLKAEFGSLLADGTARVTAESLSHGKIVRKLSKKLRVSSRKVTPPIPGEFMPVRATSPVLYSSIPTPLHQESILGDAVIATNSSPSHSSTGNSIGLLDSLDVSTELSV